MFFNSWSSPGHLQILDFTSPGRGGFSISTSCFLDCCQCCFHHYLTPKILDPKLLRSVVFAAQLSAGVPPVFLQNSSKGWKCFGLSECGSSLGGDKHCVTSVERLLMNQVTPSAHQSICENKDNFKTAQKSKHFQIESARVTDLVKKTGIESRNSWRSSFSPNSVFARKRAGAAIKYLPQKHSPQK